MTWLFVLLPFALLILWYILSGREYLKKQAWAQGFFRAVEPIEIALFQKSETILAGRLIWATSAIVAAHDAVAAFAGTLNWTPVTNRLLASVPEDLRGLIIAVIPFGLGLLINWLRKRTTKPLEVVAVPQSAITPAVAEKMAVAEEAKHEVVAAIKNAEVKQEAVVVQDNIVEKQSENV
jgi:hypothetical protein